MTDQRDRYTWCRRVFHHHYRRRRRRRRRRHYLWLIIYHRSHLTAYSSSSLFIVIVFVVAVIVSSKYPDWESWIKKTDLFAYFWCHLGFRSLVTHTAGKTLKEKDVTELPLKMTSFVTVTSTGKQNQQNHNTGSVQALTHYCLANRWFRHDGNLTTHISLPAKNGEK